MKEMRERWPFVEVKWRDACRAMGWLSLDKLPHQIVVLTRGWLIAQDNTEIVVCASISGEGEETEFGEIIAVPKGCVIEVRILG